VHGAANAMSVRNAAERLIRGSTKGIGNRFQRSKGRSPDPRGTYRATEFQIAVGLPANRKLRKISARIACKF
jgi:hypothetical protein